MAMNRMLGKLAYGAGFTVLVPGLLALWAGAVHIPLPAFHDPLAGAALAGAGLALLLSGTWALWRRGGGLPMNAFPPPRLVADGIYRLLPHPLYVGFVLMCGGTSLLLGSATGLWLATPLAALGCAAIVVGYEGPDLAARFGALRPRAFLALPPADGAAAPGRERLGAAVLVLGLWLVAYEGVKLLGVPPDALDVRLPGEAAWPVWTWTEPIYVSAYLVVPTAFLLAPTRDALRALAVRSLVATAALTLLYVCLPFISPPRPVPGEGPLAELLRLEHRWSLAPVAAWPSFHVLWAGLAASALAARGRAWALGSWAWALALAASCATTGMHAIVDVAAGLLCWWPFLRLEGLYGGMLRGCERLANAWRAWRIGPVRIINHGLYPGLAAAAGILLAGWLVRDLAGLACAALGTLVGAALWAQWVEGSPALQRPFGYYGGLLGGTLALGALGLTRGGTWPVLAALAVAAPLVQALGRLRCLVQGCCHGRPTAPHLGIRVREPHSRVCRLAGLAGQPIHPTQLYSILANLALACLLGRLWSLRAPLALIGGLYLVLNGLARFMEEAYRGEPQTAVVGGLHLYQWLAVLSVMAGMAVCVLPSGPAPALPGPPTAGTWALAVGAGVGFAFAMGVDFPDSQRRFARLSG